MVPYTASHSLDLKIFEIYNILEKQIKNTKWYEFLWRRKLKNTLKTIKYQAACEGMMIALNDLHTMGIIKIKNNS